MAHEWAMSATFSNADSIVSSGQDFGFDVLTLPDLDRTFTPRRDAAIVADAFLRRLYTRRGQLWDDPTYGFYILDYLNGEVTQGEMAELVAGIEGQAELDERILWVRVRATYDIQTEKLGLRIVLRTAVGPFSLVLSITELTSEILLEA